MDTSTAPLLVATAQEDGSHSGCAYSKAVHRGRLLRLRRGIYIPTALWVGCTPSERYQLTTAATAVHCRSAVFCRETALSMHGVPLLRLPQRIHIRASSAGAVRKVPQSPLTGRLSADEFWKRAAAQEIVDDAVVSPVLLRGFDTARHATLTLPDRSVQQIALQLPSSERAAAHQSPLMAQTEVLDVVLADTLHRMEFPDAVVALEGALCSAQRGPTVTAQGITQVAEQLQTTARARQRLKQRLEFSSSFSESPGESLARVRFHQLGFRQPQQQVEVRIDGQNYRLDFLWEKYGVAGEFDGWMKYRAGFDEAWKQEKRREDSIRSTGLKVVRFYWEDLFEPGYRRLRSLLMRAGVPRLENCT